MTTILGALSPQDVSAFMTAGMSSISGFALPAFSYDGDLPALPARLYTITGPYGGTGLTMEFAYDNLAFHLRSRGKKGIGEVGKAAAAEDARIVAWTADRFLLEAPTPTAMGAQHVNLITRSGGPPTFLTRDPASGCVTFVCNYLLNTARY